MAFKFNLLKILQKIHTEFLHNNAVMYLRRNVPTVEGKYELSNYHNYREGGHEE